MTRPAAFQPRASAAPAPASWMTGQTARWIGITAFLLLAITGGGRVVGSDEVTMLELSRAMLRGGIAVPAGAVTRCTRSSQGPRTTDAVSTRTGPAGSSS